MNHIIEAPDPLDHPWESHSISIGLFNQFTFLYLLVRFIKFFDKLKPLKLSEYSKMHNFEFDFQLFCQMSSLAIPQPKNNTEEQVFTPLNFISYLDYVYVVFMFQINCSRKLSD